MGRWTPRRPEEEASSRGESRARPAAEPADLGHPLIPAWWVVGGLLYGTAMVCCAYALRVGRWWLWLCVLALLAVVGLRAARTAGRPGGDASEQAEQGHVVRPGTTRPDS